MKQDAKNQAAIAIEHLTKSYGKSRGVIDLSFQVNKGDIFGFLGPNGAGKSTTIRSMLGFLKADEGKISILGMDSVTQHVEILKKIGYLPSETWFYPNMRVIEVLRLAAEVRESDCTAEQEKLCERLKVDTRKRISELSLGNRKKVGIVCAMQHRPELFIFDEPTSGLDPLMQTVFFELIQEYVAKGATCMLSTHVLSEVKEYCNRAAIMKEGKLVRVATVEELTASNAKHVKTVGADGKKEYLYRGDINELMRKLSKESYQDVLIEEPSMEEIFLQYYEEK